MQTLEEVVRIKKSKVLFNMGYKLRSQDLALLASAGVPHVSVLKDYELVYYLPAMN